MHASARWTALALVAVVAACENGAGPEAEDDFDARSVADDYAAVEQILASADWQGLGVVARAAPAVAPAGGPAGAPLISDFHRGDTFVYDAEAGDWVVDPDREGAPDNGVRFILYEEPGGVPDPSQERGWADLIDEGDGSVEDVVLRLRVQEDGVATMDYGLRADHDGSRGLVAVQGFVVGDGERLDFDVTVEGREGGPNEIVFDMAVDERGFAVGGNVLGSDHSDDGEVHLSASHRTHTVDLDFVSAGGVLDGGIDLDGTPFVQVAGAADDPVFTRPDGSPLRPLEVLALLRVVDFTEDVFDLVEDVLDPVGEIVALGFIL